MRNSSSNARPPFCNHLLHSLLPYTPVSQNKSDPLCILAYVWAPVHSPPRVIPFSEWRYGWMCVLTYPTAATLIAFDTTTVMLLLYQLYIDLFCNLRLFASTVYLTHRSKLLLLPAMQRFFVQVNLHFTLEAAGRVII